MSSFDELILRRRSVRRFDASRPVAREEITALARAAQEAPSWNNFQASRYHVVLSEAVKRALGECLAPFDATILASAPAAVVTTFVRGRSGFRSEQPVDELGDGWGIYDLGLHNAYFLLKATDAGLDSIVLGLRDAQKIKQLLRLPEEESVVAVIAVGHRVDDAKRPPRKPVDAIITFY